MPSISAAYEVIDSIDPKQAIIERVAGYIDDIDIGGRDVLVAIYKPSSEARTKTGLLYLPDKIRDESDWQGVTGLVLKLGPLAYETDASRHWFCDKDGNPKPPQVGEWVLFDVKDTHPFILGHQTCRLLGDQYVRAKLQRPDMAA